MTSSRALARRPPGEPGYGSCRAMESRAQKPARLPTALGKRPPLHRTRFPQLPQPLPLEREGYQRRIKTKPPTEVLPMSPV
jgi:hypothetical protein